MRELKFRVIENDRIVAVEFSDPNFNDGAWYHTLISEGEDGLIHYGGYVGKGLVPRFREQYTGKEDGKDKEIYEGDIIRDCNGLDLTWVIEWSEEEACFLGLDWCGELNEVIGNIHENPELLVK